MQLLKVSNILARKLQALSPVTKTAIVLPISIFIYEELKQILFPEISIWHSHLTTVAVTTIIGTALVSRALKAQERLQERTFQEIAERKCAESALQIASNQLSAIIDASPFAIYTVDSNGIVLSWNAASEKIFGWSAPEILGKPLPFIDKADYQAFITNHSKQVFQGKAQCSIETWRRRRDGSPIHLNISASLLHDGEGQIDSVIAVVADLTEKNRIEQTLQEQQNLIHTIISLTPIVVFALDMEGRFTLSEGYGLSQLGLQPGQVVGQSVYDVYKQFPALLSDLGRCFHGETVKAVHEVASFVWDLCCTPLRNSKGDMIGVTGIATDITERRKMEIALQNAQSDLEQRVQQRTAELAEANMALYSAYDTTIVGWSHALDLRDRETEGHTLRVTEMTLRLAEIMGIEEEEQLVQIRRGALLHDIGKMGIPDSILLKPGPLTDAEWEIMRMHPQYAYEMLSPIEFLQPALDIPYCHHEKWDGSGYPRQLKGQAIPLSARIFAVADVWDALRSDRPYRSGWSDSRVREHIASLSGAHFEPAVVEAFLKLMALDDAKVLPAAAA